MLRPATDTDRDAVIALGLAEDVVWFGAAEQTAEEMGEFLGQLGGMSAGVVAVDAGGRVVGFAAVGPAREGLLIIDPADARPPYRELATWIHDNGGSSVFTYGEDAPRHAALETAGWHYAFSSFDLARPGADPVDKPQWPPGVAVVPLDFERDAARVHRLIYVDARWADIRGHLDRSLDAWRQMYGDHDRGWIGQRADVPVGVVIGRVFSDGRAWIQQIAVATGERRSGLGRALLLHAYTELLATGATSLALNVQAANPGALGLYRSIGLEVSREWRIFERA
ncbi:MAG: GNAT family N-acetyltransferase [Actinomycetes bacterium]